MSTAYDQGVVLPFDRLGSIVTPVYGIALHSFPNRTPLFTRLPQAPLGSLQFKTSTVLYRPSSSSVATAYTSGGTSLVVPDASMFQSGDTIEVDSEEMLVTAVNVGTNTLTVVGAYAGTTAANHAQNAVVYLIGNSRTGGEINVNGISRIPQVVMQNAQTFQHPYAVGGSMASATDTALPPGVTSVVGRERMMAIQNCSDDIERSLYYSRPVALSASDATVKPAMAGLRTLIATNNTSSPTNASAYKPSDLIRDTVQKVYDGGGNPDTLIVSTDFMGGLTTWTQGLVRIPAGATSFGVNIDMFEAPFLSGVGIIPAPLLRKGTVICLSGPEARLRVKRNLYDKPRGSQGDADMGDILFEGAIELDNESHHAFVSGITGFSAS